MVRSYVRMASSWDWGRLAYVSLYVCIYVGWKPWSSHALGSMGMPEWNACLYEDVHTDAYGNVFEFHGPNFRCMHRYAICSAKKPLIPLPLRIWFPSDWLLHQSVRVNGKGLRA